MGVLTISAGRPNGGGHVGHQPVVLILPGYERFAAGLGPRSFSHVAVRRFRNRELHVDVPEDVAGRRCVIVGSISPPAGNLERFTLVAHALRRAGAARISALLPYLAYARQDRARATESLGLAWVGELLRASGIDRIVCVDVHSSRAGELLGLPLASLSPAGLLAGALPAAWRSGATFVAPDEGAIGRCSAVAQAAGIERAVVWARKLRTGSGIEHLGLVGTPDRRAIVVDDILDTGETLVSCCHALREAGTREICVVATHALFTGVQWRALFADGVRGIWITDTVLSRGRPVQAQVVPVAALLAPVLEGRL